MADQVRRVLRVITITQFFEEKFGSRVALLFSIANILMFALIYMGSTLFWGSYCVNLVFPEIAQYFGETDKSVKRKVRSALVHGLTPIICVGENLVDNEGGRTALVVEQQVRAAYEDVTREQALQTIVAYEPVWAIGTGQACNGREANRVISIIRQTVYDIQGTVAADIRIQYGGSVTTNNIGDIISQPEIDGALVGGASLNAKSFSTIVQATSLQGKEN